MFRGAGTNMISVVVSNILFLILPGEMIHFDEHIFQMGWSHKLVMHRRTKYSNPGQLHPPMPPTLTFADGGVMPFSSGFEYVVLRYGKSYMKYASQMLLNYFLCRIWWICVHLFVGYVQIYVSILYVNMFIYTYIYKSIYIYMPSTTQQCTI